ncbi:pyridoxal-phosphate dependent enzyme [Piscicoccus intestinalis]|uniref:pyridoxal-phosphate dependent enzyme n=1 Tax=Piscicoccus intestinalis TaxID=746033 RepID=UPI00083947A2|nr:pyridoxal-phosphate dependent enzyme [Piscicoccus intestinalis]
MTTQWHSAPRARRCIGPPTPAPARDFHRTLPDYRPTPLVEAPALADELGVARVLVKDESHRLGLAAFKVLGASWACAQVSRARPGVGFVTATDGNHGRAVARMAAHFGVPATVLVPRVMTARAAEAIESEGAKVVRHDGDYDETVAAAARFAHREDLALVQDTAWDGYEDVPAWIVEGYQTLLQEIDEELGAAPSLVAVPVGVGSLAEAVVRRYRRPSPEETEINTPRPATARDVVAGPSVLSVEPDTAACVLTSLRAGRPTSVETGDTAMAGLNCGTVSASAWPILAAGCDAAVTVSDEQALSAAEDLAGLGISSGPSGAASLAGARAALTDRRRRADLDLPQDATVVLLNTEGTPGG